ncbi:hypothetical protein TNCV_2768741 [Trichonephila clavipes]|nr:hypothetical protein TNCV_2768741 [Trichonephila clavipes]
MLPTLSRKPKIMPFWTSDNSLHVCITPTTVAEALRHSLYTLNSTAMPASFCDWLFNVKVENLTVTFVRVRHFYTFLLLELEVANFWFLSKQDAISNKIPPQIRMDRLKFKLEINEVLAASPPTNKSILADDDDEENNSVVIPLPKRSKCYDPPAIHVRPFILTTPG